MATAIVIAIPMPMMVYVLSDACSGKGDSVIGASDMPIWVCAYELKYELDPSNDAMIVYVPGMSGVKTYEYCPFMSVVVVPMMKQLLFESMYDNVTGTPVAFVGFGICMYRYSIQSLMLSSAIAGVPAAGMPRQVCPGD